MPTSFCTGCVQLPPGGGGAEARVRSKAVKIGTNAVAIKLLGSLILQRTRYDLRTLSQEIQIFPKICKKFQKFRRFQE